LNLEKKYKVIEKNEIRFEEYNINKNNEMVCVAWGMGARIVKSAIDDLNAEGYNIGLIRPITVWPFPYQAIRKAIGTKVKNVNVFELNLGQMLEDVRLAVCEKVPVNFMGKVGGVLFTPAEIEADIRKYFKKTAASIPSLGGDKGEGKKSGLLRKDSKKTPRNDESGLLRKDSKKTPRNDEKRRTNASRSNKTK
jgi:pyruvate/2-oxoacid:ferredoxin oxidoreductase alpha subunit